MTTVMETSARDVYRQMKGIVSQRPDGWTYMMELGYKSSGLCQYHNGTKALCLVGHWLFENTSVSISDVDGGSNIVSICALLEELEITFKDEWVVPLLLMVQENQDRGIPWDESLDYAVEELENQGVDTSHWDV